MAKAKKDKGPLLEEAGEALGKYYADLKRVRNNPRTIDVLRPPEDFEAEIEAWREKGLEGGDRVSHYEFYDHPEQKDNAVPFSAMKALLAEYRPLYAAYKAVFDLSMAENAFRSMSDYVKPDESFITAETIADCERKGDPKACLAALKAARAVDPEMRVGMRSMSLDEFEAQICKPLGEVTRGWTAAARAALRARNEKAAAPYQAAGIGGQKLDLIVAYAGVSWRLKGGEASDEPKKLAKASVLFHWLDAPDRIDPRYMINTIRRYEFKGNDLAGVSEERFRRPKGADLSDAFK